MGLTYNGSLSLAGNIKVNTSAPLDNRMVVDNVSDLTSNIFGNYAYVGLLVYAVETKEHYVLTALPNTVTSNWKKISSESSESSQETFVIDI